MVTDGEFADVLTANRAYAGHFELAGLEPRAAKGLGVLTCMDSRIDPLGDARTGARRREDPAQRGRPRHRRRTPHLVLADHLLGVDRVMVVAHTNCRMAGGTEEDVHAAIQASGGPDTRSISFLTTGDQESALREDVQRVRSWPYLDNVAVGGFIYDLGQRPAPTHLLATEPTDC